MAKLQLLRLRKSINALYRAAHIRSIASEATGTSLTPEEQTAFVRATDQKLLRETKDQADTLIAHIKKVKATVQSLPTTVQKDPTIPPYTIGFLRQRIREVPIAADAVIASTEHIKDHLTDLQYEPYLDRAQSSMAEWEVEIAKMSKAQREEKLQNMMFSEEAELHRLKVNSENLIKNVEAIKAMSRKGESLDAPEKRANPFAGEVGEKKGEKDSKGKEAAAEVAQSAPKNPLAEMQKRLEREQYGKA